MKNLPRNKQRQITKAIGRASNVYELAAICYNGALTLTEGAQYIRQTSPTGGERQKRLTSYWECVFAFRVRDGI